MTESMRNRPTQLVAMWIDNDEYLLERAVEVVQESYSYKIERDKALREFMESAAQDEAPAVYEASFVADLYQWAMAHVNWNIIVDDLLEEYPVDEDEEDEDEE